MVGVLVIAFDGVGQRVTVDKAHSVVRFAVRIAAETVNGHDTGMFELAGDLGFEQEARPRIEIGGGEVLHTFESDVAAQFLVFCDEDDAETALGMKGQRPIAARTDVRRQLLLRGVTVAGEDGVDGAELVEQLAEVVEQVGAVAAQVFRRCGAAMRLGVFPPFQQFGELVFAGHDVLFLDRAVWPAGLALAVPPVKLNLSKSRTRAY